MKQLLSISSMFLATRTYKYSICRLFGLKSFDMLRSFLLSNNKNLYVKTQYIILQKVTIDVTKKKLFQTGLEINETCKNSSTKNFTWRLDPDKCAMQIINYV